MATTTGPNIVQVVGTLRRWRERSALTIDDLAYQIRHEMPPPERLNGLSRETIRRYESGAVDPDRMSTALLFVWAKVCGADFAELGEPFVSNAATLREALSEQVRTGSRCWRESPGQPTLPFALEDSLLAAS